MNFVRKDIPFANILLMCQMQNNANCTQHKPDWLNTDDKERPDHRAAYTELVEGLEHLGWGAWWKKQSELTESQMHQVRLEIVDVFHFLISMEMRGTYSLNVINPEHAVDPTQYTAERIHEAFTNTAEAGAELDEGEQPDVLVYFDQLIGYLALHQEINWETFVNIMDMLNMQPADLYAWYLGKNTLNLFRGCNGYKQGDYIKSDWNEACPQRADFGAEDNVFLEHLLVNTLSQEDGLSRLTPEFIYGELMDSYREVLGVTYFQRGTDSVHIDNRGITWADTEDGIKWAQLTPTQQINDDSVVWEDYDGWSGAKRPIFVELTK